MIFIGADGVREIGNHRLIAAGSPVTRDIPPRGSAWGTPCEVRETRTGQP